MKKFSMIVAAVALNGLLATSASAATIDLAGWATNSDGSFVSNSVDPNQTIASKSFSLTFNTAGAHTAIGFIDVEIDQLVNTWFNEFGATNGALGAGQSWEIDEPGFTFGDILTNVAAGKLDNTNGVPATAPDDVSLALGLDFVLGSGQTAVVTYLLSSERPTTPFFLSQTDPDSQATVYFSETLAVRDSCPQGGCPVPEPSMPWLFAPAIAGLLLSRRKAAKPD